MVRRPGSFLQLSRRRLVAILSATTVAVLTVPLAGSSAAAPGTPNGPAGVVYSSSSVPLQDLGTFNLTQLAAQTATLGFPSPPQPVPGAAPSHPGAVPLGPPPNTGATGKPVSAGSFSVLTGNVAQEVGFEGDSSALFAEPPDQGSCAGPDASGNPIAFDFLNGVIGAYSTTGTQRLLLPFNELGALSAYSDLNLINLSDPRCYYDWPTGRWFLTIFGTTLVQPFRSTQFLAVSQGADPLGNYEVFAIDTTDASNSAGGCPCWGDFDQIGADSNGFYIATSEFNIDGYYGLGPSVFDGSILYAVSKQGLEAAADGSTPPDVVRYRLTADAFGSGTAGPYHVSPASTPPGGAFAPDSEYFVESNSTATSDDHLIVYALTSTDSLAAGGTPSLVATDITSEDYAFPPDAIQRSGPIPSGSTLFGATTPSPLNTDFNAVQEVSYTDGKLFAALDTAAGASNAPVAAAAWFVLTPATGSSGLSVQLDRQGYVASSQDVMYPDLVVDARGNGYLAFSISGPQVFPSPAYIAFHAAAGPTGPIHLATTGTAPYDSVFSCYPTGPCRWGDYSGGAVWDGRIYMMAEYVPGVSTSYYYTNSETYVWSAPVP